jgi:hypothetical protein
MSARAREEAVEHNEDNEHGLEAIESHLELVVEQLAELIGQNRFQGAMSVIQSQGMFLVAVTGGLVAIIGVIMAMVLWAISQVTGWLQWLHWAFLLVLVVLLLRQLDQYRHYTRLIHATIEDWMKLEFGEQALEKMREWEKERKEAAQKWWVRRLLGRWGRRED